MIAYLYSFLELIPICSAAGRLLDLKNKAQPVLLPYRKADDVYLDLRHAEKRKTKN